MFISEQYDIVVECSAEFFWAGICRSSCELTVSPTRLFANL